MATNAAHAATATEANHAAQADNALLATNAAHAATATEATHAATATAADRAATLSNGSVASIDAQGNATLESLTLRSYLRVQELIHNRLNALEGDTSFSDAGEIEALSPDGTVATMRRRWEGDTTPFQPGDILYGYSAPNADGAVFTKSWVKVVSVDRGNNALTLTAYPDADVPGGRNFPVSVGMLLTRWGNASDSSRQSTAFVSSEGGHMVQLRDVATPKITAANYATVWGRIPSDLRNSDDLLPVSDLINSAHPYLYARGIVVSDLIRTDYTDPTPPRYTPNLLDSTAQGVALWRYYASPSATLAVAPHAASDYSPGYVGVDFPIGGKGLQWFTMFYPVAASAIRAGKSYTLSFCIYLDAPTSLQIDVATASGSAKATSTVYPAEPFPAGYSSHAIELTATANGFAGMVLRIAVSGAVSAALRNIRIGNLKLEEGYNDNPVWTPSYADLRGNDGANGTNGLNGLLAYPAGVYDSEKTYTSTADTTPVVLYNEQYYSLRRGASYRGSTEPTATSTPATDVAQLGSSSRWQHFDTFKSVFADIVMANFAKLGAAVFSGDWMLSQQGIKRVGFSREESTDFKSFNPSAPLLNPFTPHFSVNFATGELRANKGTIGGDLTASTLNLKVSSAGATTPDGSICVGVNAVTLPALTPGSVRSIRIFNPGKPAPLGAPSLTLTGADASVHITRMADPETTLQQFVMAKCGAGSGRFFEVIGYRKDSGLNTKTLWYVSELNNGSNKPLTFTLTEGGGFQVVETVTS